MSRVRQPKVGFLSLSREIRQMILLETITEESFCKDQEFHKLLQGLPKSILTKIFGYATGTNLECEKSRCTCIDCGERSYVKHNGQRVYAPWLATTILMDEYRLVPISVLEIAMRINAVHPMIKEDMSWVLLQRLNEWDLKIRVDARHGIVCPLDLFCTKWCANERNSLESTISLN